MNEVVPQKTNLISSEQLFNKAVKMGGFKSSVDPKSLKGGAIKIEPRDKFDVRSVKDEFKSLFGGNLKSGLASQTPEERLKDESLSKIILKKAQKVTGDFI